MLLTLNASCLRGQLLGQPGKTPPSLALADLPQYTREVLGLGGLNLTTDLLVGADRRKLEAFRERADRAGCPCLLLIESQAQNLGSSDGAAAEAAIERMHRVIQAAQILSCTAAALRVDAPDDDNAMQLVWQRLRKIVDRAERLELNLLVCPSKGLTSKPERMTDLIKKVGGFRIGTLPDFQFAREAAGSDDEAVTYLRRITPYASAVLASTLDFSDPPEGGLKLPPKVPARKRDEDDEDEAPKKKSARSAIPPKDEDEEAAAKTKPKKKAAKGDAKSEAKAEAKPESKGDMGEAEAKPAKGKKGAKEAPLPAAKPAAPDADDDEVEELDDAALEDLIADIFSGEGGDAPATPVEPLPAHKAYDVFKMVAAVASVGFDSTLAVDYRGGGDVTLGIRKSQRLLRAALDHAAASA
ncbi:MAG TPA: TIM barrel protein [Phycisphaerales bacterium]